MHYFGIMFNLNWTYSVQKNASVFQKLHQLLAVHCFVNSKIDHLKLFLLQY